LFSNENLDISKTVLSAPYPNKFTGMSSMNMYECVKSTYDSISHSYKTQIFDSIYNYIKPLNLKAYRFPGGTIGNYYHFYGKGHGIDTSETVCAAGRVSTNNFANQFLGFDNRVDKNNIVYLKEEIDTLKKYTDNIGICFRVNSHTHFYKGDLKVYSDSIQYLIRKYFSNDSAFLNTNGNALDSAKISAIVTKLLQLQNDAIYARMKRRLASTSGFQYRFKENMDAVAYLRNAGINILGAEIGNETYAEYVVFDDNYKYVGLDCTQIPDSFHINLLDLPLKYYFEGLLKNNLLVSLYADSLKTKYNIVSGVPATNGVNYLTLNNQYAPVHIKPYNLSVKKSDLWNKYFASQANVFALIPHLYSQEFLTCSDYMQVESLYGMTKPATNKIAERFYKYFIDTLLVYNLQRYNFYGNNKPLWITEWNFSENSFATNTFLHAFYNYYFIRKAVEIHNYSPDYIQILFYHHLSGSSHIWPIIKTNSSPVQFTAEKQITYSPFYIWSNTFNQQVKKVNTTVGQNINSTIIDIFINNTKDELIIQFVNTDSIKHFINFNNINILNGSNNLEAEKIDRYILDAADFTSTNFTQCNFFNNPSFDNSYSITEDTLLQKDTLWMPSISMGKFTLHLTNKVTTSIFNHTKSEKFIIYPNPTEKTLTLHIPSFQNQNTYAYKIYDVLGKLEMNGKINSINSDINIELLSKGTHIITLESELQHKDYQVFIKK
jgi:hypothetical protein